MSRLTGEVWKEYLEIRHEAAARHGKAEVRVDALGGGTEKELVEAQVHDTLAVAGRLECLCYLISKMEGPA